jgi:hypothetical protein
VIFREASHPKINRVYASIQCEELGLHGWIQGDLSETGDTWNSIGGSSRIVVRKPMVAPALDVERSEVESTSPGRAEEEVPQTIDELGVHFLSFIRG